MTGGIRAKRGSGRESTERGRRRTVGRGGPGRRPRRRRQGRGRRRTAGLGGRSANRGQTNLIALVAGLVALVAVTALGLSMATAAFDGADRPVEPRRVAVSLSERLVSPTSPLTDRANVLDEGALAGLDAEALRSSFPVVGNRSVRVRIDGRPVVDDGNPDGGVTVRRIVMLRERQSVTVRPNLTAGDGYTTTLPRRTRRVEVTVDPPDGTTVRALRANGRVVLRNPSGIEGTYTIRVSRFETAELAFDVRGRLEEGDVTITYYPAETTKAVLEVTVGEPT